MAIKAVIWDIGGVLERTEDFGPRQALAQRLGWEIDPLMDLIFGSSDDYRVQLGQISYQDHWHNVRQTLDQTEMEMFKTLNQFFAGDRLDFELVDYVRQLRKDYTTAVLSNYSPILRDKIDHLWRIADAFDHLVISAEVGVKKPDPRIYQLALEKVGVPAGEAVFIDDAAENVSAARDIGIHAVHFSDREQALGELETLLEQKNKSAR
jgi:epoxide hydrolase-like predicted phosphatase